tara:strand:+ start:302 stop:529 length:228 start_codon:yes stop_codon:yes gene_type:complete
MPKGPLKDIIYDERKNAKVNIKYRKDMLKQIVPYLQKNVNNIKRGAVIPCYSPGFQQGLFTVPLPIPEFQEGLAE